MVFSAPMVVCDVTKGNGMYVQGIFGWGIDFFFPPGI